MATHDIKNWRRLEKHFPHKTPEELRNKYKEYVRRRGEEAMGIGRKSSTWSHFRAMDR